MILEHRGATPRIADDVYVAPNAVVCGDVEIGSGCRILFGAVVVAEGGPVRIGERCVVMENAVVRGRTGYKATLGDNVLVGPHAHVNGAIVGDNAFIATNAAAFPGSRVGVAATIRIGAVLHVNSRLPDGKFVPINWVAVGDPAKILPPDRHDEIWAIQKRLDFPGTVFGVSRAPEGESHMPEAMARYSRWLGAHREDREVE
ncbi:MAG: gamma carbonic anhydrase family protein [Actinomycetota bacterium]|nr:gamma carbonic anhydrase family protein [Actinomycetota bacterium]